MPITSTSTTPPLRILQLNSARKWIGEAAHTFDLYRELEKAGHQVTIGCRHGYELEEMVTKAGFHTIALTFSSRFAPASDLRDLMQIRRLVQDEQIDIVHCHRGKDHWLAAAALLSLRRKTALIRTRHVVTPAASHLLNRWLYGRATDFVLAVSQKAMDALGPLLQLVPEQRRKVIYSAVDLEKFNPRHRSEARREEINARPGELLVGLIGRYQNIKGQHIFFEAAKTLAALHPQLKFLVAGRGSESRIVRFREQIKQAGLADRFIALGFEPELPSLLASLDIGVVASVGSEGSSRISLEFLASGVPAVATRVGGIPELLHEGKYGLLIEPNNPAQLADAIAQLAAQPQLRGELSSCGRLYAQTEKSYSRWIREIVQTYQIALASCK